MKIYKTSGEEDEIIWALEQTIEQEVGSKIFTMRVINERENKEEAIEVLVVLENKSILSGFINVEEVNGKLALRTRLNYI